MAKAKKHEINMTEGPILKSILAFAGPMMLSSVIQLFFNAVDMIVVGRWSGTSAMASVGATSSLTQLIVNLFIGMSVGTTVVVSKRYGAGNKEGMKRAIDSSITFAILVGVGVFVLGQILCRPLLMLMDTPSGDVLEGAVLYMRIIFLGKPAIVIYNFAAATLRSVGDSKRPLYILSITGAVKLVLNIVFVVFFKMGVMGASTATVIANYLSLVMFMAVLMGKNFTCRVELKKLRIYKEELIEIVTVGIPAGLHNTFTSLTTTLIQSAVNSFGVAAIAGNAAAANIETFVFAIKAAFRQATVTAVSQNYGAKKEERISKSVKSSLLCMLAGCILLSVVIIIFSKQLLGIYITDSAEAIKFGQIRLVVTALPYFLSGLMEITSGYLRGIGYSTLTAVNSFIGLIIFRILYLLFVFPIFNTFEMLYIATPMTWLFVAVLNIISLMAVKKKAFAKMYED